MSSQVSEVPRRGLNARQVDTVEKLLAAGLEELRAVGHDTLTVRTVAQRAGVSPATAYTYLASKNHLFAELFWRHLADAEPPDAPSGATAVVRVQATVRALTARIVEEPTLAAAVTPALLGTDPDVERLRLRIGGEFVSRFEEALAEPGRPADPAVLEVLVLTFSGALLQAGMGLMTYDQMAERLVSAVDVILRGN
ncbi:TetR/AcrR family transcriptional regulator [Nocardioides humilatus]|uniref:TetR/AcrR family transcriptional regulator n=1 Tax=Nocardioides humilatus TaxID=2607660 RepID=A0A5B1L769_9ACTN|nr:TetR/AcrR family transcriptional regulator [Nocardioides humilatus]KAA1416385.1 TetR/AcrR family transcriptional regulator [Nocardioides humilatus]